MIHEHRDVNEIHQLEHVQQALSHVHQGDFTPGAGVPLHEVEIVQPDAPDLAVFKMDHQGLLDVDLGHVVPLEIAHLLQLFSLVFMKGEVAGAKEPQVEVDAVRRHDSQGLHLPDGLDLARRAHEGHPAQAPPHDGRRLLDGGGPGGVGVAVKVHAVGGVEMKPGGLDNLLPGGGQGRFPVEGAHGFADDGPVDAADVHQVGQDRRDSAAVMSARPPPTTRAFWVTGAERRWRPVLRAIRATAIRT